MLACLLVYEFLCITTCISRVGFTMVGCLDLLKCLSSLIIGLISGGCQSLYMISLSRHPLIELVLGVLVPVWRSFGGC